MEVAILTLALGVITAAAWLVFGGRAAALGPLRVLQERWPSIYGSEALLAAAAVFGYVMRVPRVRRVRRSAPGIVVLAFGAWIGELVALTLLGGSFVANEISPATAWYWWLIATG